MLNDHIQHAPVGYKISTLGYKGKYIRNRPKSQHEIVNKSLNKSNRAPVRSRVRPEIPQYSILFSLFHILQRYIHRNLPDSSKLKHRYQYICAHAHGKHFRVNLRFQIQGQPAGEGGHQITVNSMYGPGG